MTMPNFFVVGAAKSGTTSLHEYLKGHPQIFMSRVKEPNFMAFEGQTLRFKCFADEPRAAKIRDRRSYQGCLYQLSITDLDHYRALFAGAGNRPAVGESSPCYLYLPRAAERIHHHVPEARIIVILRHPVDRAYAHYLHARREGHEPLDFAAALAAEEARIRDNWSPIYHYRNRGYYSRQLTRYYDLFGVKRVRVFLFEDLCTDPGRVVREIARFLGVDDRYQPEPGLRYNVGGEEVLLTNRLAARLLPQRHLARAARRLFPEKVGRRLREHLEALGLVRVAAPPRPPLTENVRAGLLAEFAPDIRRLERLIDRDLAVWLAR